MKPKNSEKQHPQGELFKTPLRQFLNLKHTLAQLAEAIDWEYFDREFGATYCENVGRPGLPTRLMVGMSYLKYLYDLSDEASVEAFIENPYWQYFCGYEYFQTEFPCDPSSFTRFRNRIGEEGAEKLFQSTLKTAHQLGLLRAQDCQRVIVDTTVQEKNISFPTDAKILFKMREKLVDFAQKAGIKLRQSYARVGKLLLLKQSKYAHAKQYKRARRTVKKLRTQLGRVIRDIQRKCQEPSEELKNLLALALRLFRQKKEDSNKIYSLHEPHVECIAKGKAHKPYEFGCKVGLVITAKKNWIIGAHAIHGNPFDGHTLKQSISVTEKNTGVRVKDAFVDKGYRGQAHHPTHIRVFISGRRRLPKSLKVLLRRRSAVEPIIGHTKHDHRMDVNLLKGPLGDKINVLLAAAAFNLRKTLRGFPTSAGFYFEILCKNYLIAFQL